jgi:hypothetical protein
MNELIQGPVVEEKQTRRAIAMYARIWKISRNVLSNKKFMI